MKLAGSADKGAARMTELGELRDHIDCEVWLGKWTDCDPGRDSAIEQGLLKLGGSPERRKVADKRGRVRYLKLAVIDAWARERQARRHFRSNRQDIFAEINRGFEKVREFGRS